MRVFGYTDGIRGQRNDGWACVDFMTGEQVWREPKLGKGTITFADGRLYCRDEKKNSGEVVLIDASPQGWNERGRFKQPDQSGKEQWPHIVIANGRMYLRDQATLLCYDVKAK